MFGMYDGYHFFGVHMLWWFFWIVFFTVIFSAFETVRRNRRCKEEEKSVSRRSEAPKDDMK
jgi:uncharacterized membrane protein